MRRAVCITSSDGDVLAVWIVGSLHEARTLRDEAEQIVRGHIDYRGQMSVEITQISEGYPTNADIEEKIAEHYET